MSSLLTLSSLSVFFNDGVDFLESLHNNDTIAPVGVLSWLN